MNGTIDDLDKLIDQGEEQRIWDRLDGLLKTANIVPWGSQSKGMIISDLHQGDGGPADDYKKNDTLTSETVARYQALGYVVIGAGDIVDGWKFEFSNIKYTQPSFDYRIQGNHDRALGIFPEAILLKGNGNSILIDHGYAGETTTDVGWKTSRWVVRHVWMPLQASGLVRDPTTHPCPSVNPDRHDIVVRARHNWAFERKQLLAYGHIHAGWEDRPYVFNDDCCIHDGGIGALIVEGFEIHLEHFN
jgi:hypothetical protein